MQRIFLVISILAVIVMFVAYMFGLHLEDPSSSDPAIQATVNRHMLTAMGALMVITLIHAIAFTYFMGTGRWLEDVSKSYQLSDSYFQKSRQLKYRVMYLMGVCVTLLIITGATGAAADPASPFDFERWTHLKPSTLHFLCTSTTLFVNLIAFSLEYVAICKNGSLIQDVMAEVRTIRIERGLPRRSVTYFSAAFSAFSCFQCSRSKGANGSGFSCSSRSMIASSSRPAFASENR